MKRTPTYRWSHALPLGLLLLTVIVAGCNGASGNTQADEAGPDVRSVRVETLQLHPTTFEDVIELTGSVEALGDATLSAQAAGTVTDLAPLGQFVRAGQTVAQLDPGIARAAVEQAEAQVGVAQAQFDLAEDNLKRQEPLYRDSVISALEFENVRAQYHQARAGLAQARAGLAQAREQLKNTRVVAPFSGTIEERFVELGEQVTPGRQVVRIVNTSQVKVTAGVPERYAGDIREGTPVRVNLQAYGGQPRVGRITFVGSAVNPQNRTFPVEVELANPDGLLKPQMVAAVQVTREQMDSVLVVPQSAVIRDENGRSVFVVARTDSALVAERRAVTLGPSYGGQTVINGLEAGDEVIILGQTNLTQGDPVQVLEQYQSARAAGVPLSDEPAAE